MAKKEKDEIMEVTEEPKKVNRETLVTRWFNEYAVNDPKELKQICDIVARTAEEQFNLYIKSGNNEVFGVIFYGTFMSILDFLKSKQKKYNEMTIEICNSLNIGYTNNDDEENEKVGNFMPIMEYIGENRRIANNEFATSVDDTTKAYIRWKELNTKKNIEYYKTIQESAYELLKTEYKTNLRTSEAVIPLFCIFMDTIAGVLKAKYRELKDTNVSETHINIFGLFDAYYSYNEDNEDQPECMDYVPGIALKIYMKNDEISSMER